MQTVAGYIRVSTNGQAENFSLPEQARLIQDYCDREKLNLVAIYKDVESAKTVNERKGFKASIRHVWGHNCAPLDGLIVINYDRFSRTVADSELLREAFRKKGKILRSVQESFDLDDIFGLMAFQNRQTFAELERKLIHKRLWGSRTAAVTRGSWIGHKPAFGKKIVTIKENGVKIKKLVDDEQQRLTISAIMRLRRRGFTFVRIAEMLDQEGFAPPESRKWNQSSVRHIYARESQKLASLLRNSAS